MQSRSSPMCVKVRYGANRKGGGQKMEETPKQPNRRHDYWRGKAGTPRSAKIVSKTSSVDREATPVETEAKRPKFEPRRCIIAKIESKRRKGRKSRRKGGSGY